MYRLGHFEWVKDNATPLVEGECPTPHSSAPRHTSVTSDDALGSCLAVWTPHATHAPLNLPPTAIGGRRQPSPLPPVLAVSHPHSNLLLLLVATNHCSSLMSLMGHHLLALHLPTLPALPFFLCHAAHKWLHAGTPGTPGGIAFGSQTVEKVLMKAYTTAYKLSDREADALLLEDVRLTKKCIMFLLAEASCRGMRWPVDCLRQKVCGRSGRL